MTCIAGYVDKINNIGYIASDKNGFNSDNAIEFKNNKIFIYKGTNYTNLLNNGYSILIGVSGSYREIDLLEYCYDLFNDFDSNNTASKNNNINREFIIKRVIPKLQILFNKKDKMESNILFIINSNIYIVQKDYSVMKPKEPFYAIGSGDLYAFGAIKGISLFIENNPLLFKDNNTKSNYYKQILKFAIEASKYYPGIGGEIDFLSTKSM